MKLKIYPITHTFPTILEKKKNFVTRPGVVVGLGHALRVPGGAKILVYERILTKLKILPINHTFPTILDFFLLSVLGEW